MDGRGNMPPWYEGRTRYYDPTLPCLMDTRVHVVALTLQLEPPGHSNRHDKLIHTVNMSAGHLTHEHNNTCSYPAHRLSQKNNTYDWKLRSSLSLKHLHLVCNCSSIKAGQDITKSSVTTTGK